MGLETLGETEHDEKYKNKEWLEEQYIHQGISQSSIAEKCGVERGTIRYWLGKLGVEMSRDCPVCGECFDNLGNHFGQTECGYPDLTERQKKITAGLMLGDSWYDKRKGKYGGVGLEMTNIQFMKWVREETGWLFREPKLKRSSREHAFNSLFRDNYGGVREEGYKDTYSFYSVGHPWFGKLDWRENGMKKFPEDIILSPTVVKMWYCCDGNLHTSNPSESARITASGFKEDLDVIADKFEDKVCRPTVSGDTLVFNAEETVGLMEWLGEPPEGMEYKFTGGREGDEHYVR